MERFSVSRIALADTPLVGPLVRHYLEKKEDIKKYVQVENDIEAICDSISQRAAFSVDRALLNRVLVAQYDELRQAGEVISAEVSDRIDALSSEGVYTITTGHQLQIGGGPLFFMYKILSAIRLAEEVNERSGKLTAVPVFWLASEDHDIEEIRHLRCNQKIYSWETDWKGASGKLMCDGLPELFSTLIGEMNPSLQYKDLAASLLSAYSTGRNLSLATRIFVNRIFGKYGLVMIDPDQVDMKRKMRRLFLEIGRAHV